MKRTTLILLGVFVLAAIGGGAFWFREKKEMKTPVVQQNQDNQSPAKATESIMEESNEVWFPVPELGIEIKVRRDIAPELIYQVKRTERENNAVISAQFTTKRLIDIGKKNGLDTYDSTSSYACHAGYFVRYNVSSDDFLKKQEYEYERNHGAVVDGIPIVYLSAQSYCSRENEDIQYEQYVHTGWWKECATDLGGCLQQSVREIS